MEETTGENIMRRMAWAVLSRPVNGRSEVIKITNHEEADETVQQHPELFYKSGPFMLTEQTNPNLSVMSDRLVLT